MEILARRSGARVRSVLFDFDGTISTLRYGWEEVMGPMMVEMIGACGAEPEEDIRRRVLAYIDESTGIQTIFQMKWLAEEVARAGGRALDPWSYKDEYNRRLMEKIAWKKESVLSGAAKAEDYLMGGAVDFLRALRERDVKIYVASGTDHEDVVSEAGALGVLPLFDSIAGAPPRQERCSKEAVLRDLIERHSLRGGEVAVIGDGKVEIALGKQAGALAIGLASDERARRGVNPVKRERLIRSGADIICGDFLEREALLAACGL